MEQTSTVAVRRSTRAASKRKVKSSTKEQTRRKRTQTAPGKKENVIAISLRQQHYYSAKMQDISIGLQRLTSHSVVGGAPLLPQSSANNSVAAGTARKVSAKENCRAVMKAWNPASAGPASGAPQNVAETGELMDITPPSSQQSEEGEKGGVGGRGGISVTGPLPRLSWAKPRELWEQMRRKDVWQKAPEEELSSRHPGILPTMRTILLDWLMEVSEEYKLHRETYYLAMDLHDRFLDTWRDVHKEHLQAIGITCLFIASKIEEIYPPKVSEFAFVTDGACAVADILEMELLICKALNWRLNHFIVTVNTWVNALMQISSHHLRPPGIKTREFEYPAYSPLEFIRVLQLLDICTLDMSSRRFGSSILAASALYLASERSRQHFTAITGLSVEVVNDCVVWMYPFACVISKTSPVSQRAFSGVTPQDLHNIQTHSVTIAMLDDALELKNSQSLFANGAPLPSDSSLLTPPRSDRRCLAPINVSATY